MSSALREIDTAEQILRYAGISAVRADLSGGYSGVGAVLFSSRRVGRSSKPSGVSSHVFGYRCRGARTIRRDKPRSFKGRIGLPGMSSFVAAEERCDWECDGPHEMVAFFLESQFIASMAEEVLTTGADRLQFHDCAFRSDQEGALLGRLLEHRLRSAEPMWGLEVDGMALLFGAYILRRFSNKERTQRQPARSPQLTAKTLQRTIDYLNANLSAPLRLADIAAAADLSPYYFARAFRGSVGTSPHRYLTRLRIMRAQELLGSGAVPLSQIAYAVGFADQSHFTTTFRTEVGATPAQFRKWRRS